MSWSKKKLNFGEEGLNFGFCGEDLIFPRPMTCRSQGMISRSHSHGYRRLTFIYVMGGTGVIGSDFIIPTINNPPHRPNKGN